MRRSHVDKRAARSRPARQCLSDTGHRDAPPDGYVTNSWPSYFGPARFISAEEFAEVGKLAMGDYDRQPRRERDRRKEQD